MNRYAMTARHLVTNSWLVRGAFMLFALACCGFLYFGISGPTVLLFAMVLASVGFTSRRFFESERRALVPDMNETCAKVAIATLVLFWVVSVALVFSHWQPFPALIGGCFLGLAFALWIGTLDHVAAMLTFPGYAFFMIAFTNSDSAKAGGIWFVELPTLWHVALSVLFGVIGIAMIARFWFVVTSRHSPFTKVEKTENKVGVGWFLSVLFLPYVFAANGVRNHVRILSFSEWIQIAIETGLHVLIAFAVGVAMFVFWKALIRYSLPNRVDPERIGPVMTNWVKQNLVKMASWAFVVIFTIVFVSTRLIDAWREDESIYAMSGFINGFMPFLTASMLLYGVPNTFRRLWVSGVFERREETFRAIMLLLVLQCLFLNVAVLVLVTAMVISTELGFVPGFTIAVSMIGFGAVLFWVIAKWIPFWLEHLGFVVIFLIAGAGGSAIFLVSQSGAAMQNVSEISGRFGPVLPVALAIVVTTLLWILAIWDASKTLGKSHRLLECDNSMQEFMANAHAQ